MVIASILLFPEVRRRVMGEGAYRYKGVERCHINYIKPIFAM